MEQKDVIHSAEMDRCLVVHKWYDKFCILTTTQEEAVDILSNLDYSQVVLVLPTSIEST